MSRTSAGLTIGCTVTAIGFVAAGLLHFIKADMYARIVPPGFPSPELLVLISGIAEIAGGVGLMIRPLRRAAGWGLIALLVAVFPANVYMALAPEKFPSIPHWISWARLPLQGVLIWWVWWMAVRRTDAPRTVRPAP